MNLTSETVLQRPPELQLHIEASGRLRIQTGEFVVGCGPHGLRVLDVFARPTRLADALARLRADIAGVEDWRELTATITHFHKTGVLRSEGQPEPALGSDPASFDAVQLHVAMLNDRARTDAYLAAIREVVRPGDVVVDLGTGSGVLAVAAARAGARHVYAIEAGGVGRAAREVFRANGLADRITLVEGWSTQVTLPERADVLVTETVGAQPFGEGILELAADARKRLLKPQPHLIPSGVRVFALAVEVPPAELVKRAPVPSVLQDWRAWYDIDFGPLAAAAARSPSLAYLKPVLAREWKCLAEPVPLAEIDFAAYQDLVLDCTGTATARCAGNVSGVIVYFDLKLGPTTRLSNSPAEADAACSWYVPLWIFLEPLSVQAGDSFRISYRYRGGAAPAQVGVSRV